MTPSHMSGLRGRDRLKPSLRRSLAGVAVAGLVAAGVALPAASASAADSPVWAGDYETGNFSQFQNAPWNYLPQGPSAVTSPVRDGKYAGKYTIPGGGNRNESVPNTPSFKEGNDYWFSGSTRLGSDVQLNSSQWQVITQWKNDGTGSPPLEVKLENGQFALDGGFGHPSGSRQSATGLGAAKANVWDDWMFHIKFSSNASVGTVDAWRNGSKVVSGWHPKGGTLYPGLSSYMKLGYYRSTAISTAGTIYHDSWKVGTTQAAVAR